MTPSPSTAPASTALPNSAQAPDLTPQVGEYGVPQPSAAEPVFTIRDLSVYYGGNVALKEVSLDIMPGEITAIIGPSGCGKSTFIRCLNRMNDLIPGATVTGDVFYHGQNLYGAEVDPVTVRRRIGMVLSLI